jgi:homoserine O-acetyltransferase
MASFDVEGDLYRIRARLLYILADTDEWFPASIGRDVMSKLSKAGVDVTFHELNSRHGHYATTEEPEKWEPQAKAFLGQLDTA